DERVRLGIAVDGGTAEHFATGAQRRHAPRPALLDVGHGAAEAANPIKSDEIAASHLHFAPPPPECYPTDTLGLTHAAVRRTLPAARLGGGVLCSAGNTYAPACSRSGASCSPPHRPQRSSTEAKSRVA